ncbi:tannase/feruloyl esterase family alpha/beta hydrolase [Corynebacterium suranareeae]|nr:tannase/feruloyl esterase family alpha/beta hydrolase [Corynebacterium suranareeae]
MAAAVVAATLLVASCSTSTVESPSPISSSTSPASIDNQKCEKLVGFTIAPEAIGSADMPSGKAIITEAISMSAASAGTTSDGSAVDNPGNSTSIKTPAVPDHCQVTGSIDPLTNEAQPIGFRLSLPLEWNGNAIQLGGGGFNGTFRDTAGYISGQHSTGSTLTPLMRGYATINTDSGHAIANSPSSTSSSPTSQADATFDFALNDEMFQNFATDAYKKAKDASAAVIEEFYSHPAEKWMWFGSSEGGREGMLMAQQFPDDFDGIFAQNPVIGWSGLFTNFINTVQAVEKNDKAGAFDKGDILLVAQKTTETCDELDGIEDGVVSNYLACNDAMTPVLDELRCTDDSQQNCLSDDQMNVLSVVFTETELTPDLPSGMQSYPAFLFGGEMWSLADKIGDDPSLSYGDKDYANYLKYGVGAGKFVFSDDSNVDVVNDLDLNKIPNEVARVSSQMDTLNPDLSEFEANGGKLILHECTSDFAQSPAMGMNYYESVQDTVGSDNIDNFFRFFVSPGLDHGCGGTIDPDSIDENGTTTLGAQTSDGTKNGVPRNADWVTILEDWVLNGEEPGTEIVVTANSPADPFEVLASRPICAYPAYPHYEQGDASKAESYFCRVGKNSIRG